MTSTSTANLSSLAAETVENILSSLPARSLANCLRVCRLWKDLAERILKRRVRWICRLFHFTENDENLATKDYKHTTEAKIMEFLDDLDVVPQAMIVCTSGYLANKNEIESFLKKIQVKLPIGCSVIGCNAGGFIGETSQGHAEEIMGSNRGLSILLVPKMDNVTVGLFNISGKEISKNNENKESWKKSFETVGSQDVKFVLLIGISSPRQCIGKVVVGIKKVFGDHVVIIGGLAQPFGMLNSKLKLKGVMGLAIGGNVNASSVVHHGNLPQSLPSSFKILTSSQPPEKSACFMVSCVGRGEPFYGANNVESSEFKKVFPGVELFGFFGNGEIGNNMVDTTDKNKPDPFLNFMHSYSTVFSIVTLLGEKEVP